MGLGLGEQIHHRTTAGETDGWKPLEETGPVQGAGSSPEWLLLRMHHVFIAVNIDISISEKQFMTADKKNIFRCVSSLSNPQVVSSYHQSPDRSAIWPLQEP